jgi:hemin uptake protein HemP
MPSDTDAQLPALHASSPSPGRSPVGPEVRNFLPEPIPTDFLFQGAQEILISHNGEHYRLRITRNGKLILTK